MNRTEIAEGEFYHIYNRGVDKRDIFMDQRDYERFLCLLYIANSTSTVNLRLQGLTLSELKEADRGETLVDVVSYCLMPNHFHLLIQARDLEKTARFMQKVTTGYTMYFNRKNERTGSLFQGTYKSKHVGEDEYLRYLVSYIHLNPVKLIDSEWKENGIKDRDAAERYLKQYSHSSFRDYSGETRVENIILSKSALPEYYDSPGDFTKSVTNWLSYSLQG